VTTDRGRPTYRLEELRQALVDGAYVFHRPAREGFARMGWTGQDALDCLRHLSAEGFQKSMLGRRIKGWHDVYKVECGGENVYVHFCRTDQGLFVIAALKRDTDFD
jgi:hypothetical protein